ncbi:unnamed protein product [Paramecium sonneborni]|uniref:Uncharacterized protein n=1 Tax=Paramecium sonneborni TaxID=65129 RepID=A0A8S1NQQ4_9CILI|nr:unnamed protein product [Paramecium sonneborni]
MIMFKKNLILRGGLKIERRRKIKYFSRWCEIQNINNFLLRIQLDENEQLSYKIR